MIPNTNLSATTTPSPPCPDTPQIHHCQQCGQTFPTYRQLRTHESTKHDIRCIASLLTPTNCFANCRTIFASKPSAVQHLQNSIQKGCCTSCRSRNLQQLNRPMHLHCACCAAIDPTNSHEFACLGAKQTWSASQCPTF